MVSKPLEEKTREELIEQIRRMQDAAGPRHAGHAKEVEALKKRCANYRNGMRLANIRADVAEGRLKIVTEAFQSANNLLGRLNNG